MMWANYFMLIEPKSRSHKLAMWPTFIPTVNKFICSSRWRHFSNNNYLKLEAQRALESSISDFNPDQTALFVYRQLFVAHVWRYLTDNSDKIEFSAKVFLFLYNFWLCYFISATNKNSYRLDTIKKSYDARINFRAKNHREILWVQSDYGASNRQQKLNAGILPKTKCF